MGYRASTYCQCGRRRSPRAAAAAAAAGEVEAVGEMMIAFPCGILFP